MASPADTGLYVHIPFCVSRCRYCDFYSVTNTDGDVMRRTLNRLLYSLDFSMEKWGMESFKTVYIGGGTPSRLPADALYEFLEALGVRTGRPVEFTVEANPESLNIEFLEALSAGGADRISMGVQSYDDGLLSWLGRPAGASATEDADALLAERWQGRLSRDLLAGLPRGRGGLESDFNRALSDEPGHLSVYELTVEEGTPLARDRKSLAMLPEESASDEEWRRAVDSLKKRGYGRYEVSNFSLQGEESIHNLGYWRLDPYLGIGPSAVSTLPGTKGPVRIQQVRNLSTWLDGGEDSEAEEPLTPSQFVLETFMMALRCTEGLSSIRFESIFGTAPDSLVPRSLEKWERNGSLEIAGDWIKPTPQGLDLVDAVLVDVASELDGVRSAEIRNWPPS